ncbi:MAG TPA: HIT domain-containing protein [Candidatus Saccharimonadales bacterium]|jgi:diadenosine tetraphosphate (Ap4A) HIT family hydrolase|nr:HIT domain-containing protein [Candidatus Saccharimonadales bacterium]
MEGCPFCEINRTRNRIVHETEHSLTLLSNPRLMPGHALVIPKRHVEKPWELEDAELTDIFHEMWRVEQKLLETKLATGVDIRQNYRPFLVQGRLKVNHLHFHVLPRTNEDELYETSMRFEQFHDLSDTERDHITNLLA